MRNKSRNLLAYNREIYSKHAFLHHEIGQRLLEYIKEDFEPVTILNDGVFDSYLTDAIKVKYPSASVYENRDDNPRITFDLIISNLLLQDIWEFEAHLKSYHDCLNANGRIIFSTIGVGSFSELRVENGIAINEFADIEEIGNYMHTIGFKDSVLFIEKINLTYEKLESLLNDARVVTGRPFNPFNGLRTFNWLTKWRESMEKNYDGQHYSFSFEIIYAEASLSDIKNIRGPSNEVYVDISNLTTKK